jgi:hypothetical protein
LFDVTVLFCLQFRPTAGPFEVNTVKLRDYISKPNFVTLFESRKKMEVRAQHLNLNTSHTQNTLVHRNMCVLMTTVCSCSSLNSSCVEETFVADS